MADYNNSTHPIRNPAVLITGGSGLIGRHLTSQLLAAGYKVAHLSRYGNQFGRVRVYRWDPEKGIIDPEILRGVDYIVHLAGSSIGRAWWTTRKRKEIVESRTRPVKLLFDVIKENDIRIKAFISASGVNYYGTVSSERIFSEEDPPADDFLGRTCAGWEASADLFALAGVRTVKIRTAVVLARDQGVLPKLMMTAPYGFLTRLGTGRQYMPWIHISDLCRVYLKAIEDEGMSSAYNAVSPQHIRHDELMEALAGYAARPGLVIPVPSFLIRLGLGEMSGLLLKGSRVSSAKLAASGYTFKFKTIEDACRDLLAGIGH